MAFLDIRFPDLYNLDVQFTRERKSDDVTAISGDIYPNPKWKFTRRRGRMSWGPKDLIGIQEFINFHEVVTTKHTWRIRDASDYNSTMPGLEIGPVDQQLQIGDGVLTQVQLIKTYGYEGHFHSHPIYAPVDGTVRLAIDGVEINENADWTIDYSTGIITLDNPLPQNALLTGGYEYDLKCRLVDTEINQSYLVQDFTRIDSFTIMENPR